MPRPRPLVSPRLTRLLSLSNVHFVMPAFTGHDLNRVRFTLGPWMIGCFLDLLTQGILMCQVRFCGPAECGSVLTCARTVYKLLHLVQGRQAAHAVHSDRARRPHRPQSDRLLARLRHPRPVSTNWRSACVWIVHVEYFGDLAGAIGIVYTSWWEGGVPLMVPLPFHQPALALTNCEGRNDGLLRADILPLPSRRAVPAPLDGDSCGHSHRVRICVVYSRGASTIPCAELGLTCFQTVYIAREDGVNFNHWCAYIETRMHLRLISVFAHSCSAPRVRLRFVRSHAEPALRAHLFKLRIFL